MALNLMKFRYEDDSDGASSDDDIISDNDNRNQQHSSRQEKTGVAEEHSDKTYEDGDDLAEENEGDLAARLASLTPTLTGQLGPAELQTTQVALLHPPHGDVSLNASRRRRRVDS